MFQFPGTSGHLWKTKSSPAEVEKLAVNGEKIAIIPKGKIFKADPKKSLKNLNGWPNSRPSILHVNVYNAVFIAISCIGRKQILNIQG